MQLRRKLAVFDRVALAALAGFVGLLVMFAATLSICPALHARLHHHDAAGDPFCLACTFAKGQMGAADTAPVVAPVSLSFLCDVCPVQAAPLTDFDYHFSPSRAPPRS